jgi:hypothetical protein
MLKVDVAVGVSVTLGMPRTTAARTSDGEGWPLGATVAASSRPSTSATRSCRWLRYRFIASIGCSLSTVSSTRHAKNAATRAASATDSPRVSHCSGTVAESLSLSVTLSDVTPPDADTRSSAAILSLVRDGSDAWALMRASTGCSSGSDGDADTVRVTSGSRHSKANGGRGLDGRHVEHTARMTICAQAVTPRGENNRVEGLAPQQGSAVTLRSSTASVGTPTTAPHDSVA